MESRVTARPFTARRERQAGFTLVEVLGVLVIIGLMSAAVLLTVPRAKDPVITQSETLLRALNIAAQSSVLSDHVSAFGASTQGYIVYHYADGEWQTDMQAEWADTVRPNLKVEGIEIELKKDTAPMVMFEPAGQSTPFVLTLSGEDLSFSLTSAGDGRVSLGEL